MVLAALVFARELGNPTSVLLALATFGLFVLASASAYLLNDAMDADLDRRHPLKRDRPLAAGIVPVRVAAAAGVVGYALSIGLGVLVAWPVAVVLAVYAGLQVGYSLGLKHLAIVDLLIIAAGFVLRPAAGALAIGVAISPWLYLCTFLLALFLAVNKRWAELQSLDDPGAHRPILASYGRDFLLVMTTLTSASTLMAYALYTFSAESLPPNHLMMLTIPIVAYGLLRYVYLVLARGGGQSPERLLYRDPGILAAVAIWGAATIVILQYGN